MTALAGRVFWVSLSTSVVLLPLLLLAKPICSRYRAKSCYVLWLLLTLRLLIPVEVPLPQAPVTVEVPVVEFAVLETPQSGVETMAQTQTDPTVFQPSPVRRDISPAEILGLIWAAGVVLLLAAQWINYSTLKEKLWNNSLGNPADQQQLAQLGADVPVLRGDVESPMTFGLLRPAIFLPRELPQKDVPMVLRHELCHLRRKDLWYKGLLLLCACIHWFNPLVWKLGQVAGEHLELCCDEDVVAGQDVRFRKEYGQLLLRSAAAEQRAVLATQFGGSDLKGRIMNLFTEKKRGGALVCVVTCAALMMGSLVGCEVSAAVPDAADQSPVQSSEVSIQEEVVSTGLDDLLEQGSEAASSQEMLGEEPLLWPVEGEYTLSALHGGRTHPITGEVTGHNGIDIVADGGTEVQAVQSGVVIESDFDKQYGNYVLIGNGEGKSTLYCHMKERMVKESDTVTQGQVIGTVGKTGMATGDHLHFELRQDGEPVDPIANYPDVQLNLLIDGQEEPMPVEWPVVWN